MHYRGFPWKVTVETNHYEFPNDHSSDITQLQKLEEALNAEKAITQHFCITERWGMNIPKTTNIDCKINRLWRNQRTKILKILKVIRSNCWDRWKSQKESRRVPVAGKYWSCNCRYHNVKLLGMVVVPTTSSDLSRSPARFTAIPDIFSFSPFLFLLFTTEYYSFPKSEK